MIEIKEGQKAPFFAGSDQNGNTVELADFKGKKLVLFFYPKDNTPGCTKEACNLRDNYTDLLAKGFAVVGVSADSVKSHNKFSSKFSLPFPLISDTEKTILNDYGVIGEKKLYGKTFLGINRSTFIIDEEGKIEKIIRKVNTGGHAVQIFSLYE